MNLVSHLRELSLHLARFPWKEAALTLRQRFREDRLSLAASSLTFTTMIALVPLFTVALAVFTAFPIFAKFQDVLQKWLVESLIPDNIARQVLGYLTQFAGKASRLGALGLAVLFATALSLVLTIDRTLNSIWRVRRARPLGQRLLIYWAAITLGPLLLALSAAITSYIVSASRGVVASLPGGLPWLLYGFEVLMLAGAMAATYHYVPHMRVRWSHAWAGGLFAALGLEAAKKLLTIYLGMVPTYSAVYGAFATVPILLVWIYLAWLIVLWGAVVTAYLPALLAASARRPLGPGWRFDLALDVLGELALARARAERGLTQEQLTARTRVDPLQLGPVLDVLLGLGWVGRLEEADASAPGRLVLLADPAATLAEPLLTQLLLPRQPASARLWERGDWARLRLDEVLALKSPAETGR